VFRKCKLKPRQRVLHPVQLLEFSRLAHASEKLANHPVSPNLFLREAPERARTLIRGNYVTNRCPGSAGCVDPLPQILKMDLGS
jgi:hypothetical protein